MADKLITKTEGETILELSDDNRELFEMIEDFALRSNTEKKTVLRLDIDNGEKVIKATDHVGIIRFENGTAVELLPKFADKKTDDDIARKIFFRMLCSLFGIPYSEDVSGAVNAEDNTFLEYFISVYVRECMKIIKSGMLSGYQSVEENTSSVQGTVLFAENNRRNLVHRERLYVRHDVFTNDRAENRLMKSAASIMTKFTKSHHNAQGLKKILVYLDEVKLSDDYEADFSKCANTRNAKKYNIVLNICRLFLRNRKRPEYTGRYVSYAMIFSMQDIFRAYTAMLVKENCYGKTVKTGNSGRYLCGDMQFFPVDPDIVISDDSGNTEFVVMTKWQHIENINDVDDADIYALITWANTYRCRNAVLIYAGDPKKLRLPEKNNYTISSGNGIVALRIRSIQPTQFEGGSIVLENR